MNLVTSSDTELIEKIERLFAVQHRAEECLAAEEDPDVSELLRYVLEG